MTDRALLERAARAYWADEIDDVCSIRWLEAEKSIGYTHGDNQDHNGCDMEWVWNPLESDGDTFRLACALGLNTYFAIGRAYAENPEHEIERAVSIKGDKCAAMRRAVVMCAAAMVTE